MLPTALPLAFCLCLITPTLLTFPPAPWQLVGIGSPFQPMYYPAGLVVEGWGRTCRCVLYSNESVLLYVDEVSFGFRFPSSSSYDTYLRFVQSSDARTPSPAPQGSAPVLPAIVIWSCVDEAFLWAECPSGQIWRTPPGLQYVSYPQLT